MTRFKQLLYDNDDDVPYQLMTQNNIHDLSRFISGIYRFLHVTRISRTISSPIHIVVDYLDKI